MLAEGFTDLNHWTTWLALGVGVAVTALVIGFVVVYGRWRRRRGAASTEDDLPWEELLELMRARKQKRVAAGLPPEEDLEPEELLKVLMANMPSRYTHRPLEIPPEELRYLTGGGSEQRGSRRRWGNPTEVYLTGPGLPRRLHGLVINRSTGGLAIFLDEEIQPGTVVQVRSAEAPDYVPSVEAEVRHCRKAGKNFFLGCQFSGEIPWNVRVWFG
jgi:hypothetical protein